MMDTATPLSTLNVVEIASVKDTKLTKVSLYTGLAEVTRTCKVTLRKGDNRVVISGLPNVLVEESLRVEGHGPCTIHEVSISDIPARPISSAPTSPKLTSLLKEQERLAKALERCKKCISSVETFQETLQVQHIAAGELKNINRGIEDVAAEWDNKLIELEEKIEENTKEIEEEKVLLGEGKEDEKLTKRVSVTVAADRNCEAELFLVYGVSEATWDAAYDIYVKMDSKEKPVSLIYKAAITQSTGEDWEDVSLTLETVTPSFGLNLPELTQWSLWIDRPITFGRKSRRVSAFGGGGNDLSEKRKKSQSLALEAQYALLDKESMGTMNKRTLRVTSKGDINATFAVPGWISIPTDGTAHNVTICELELDAVMSWVAVPKESVKAHLTAKVKNDSEYTLLKGTASVYVDGSFISRSDVPAVSSQESFDCPLGIDPSIRIAYHPRSKKANRLGFTRKTCSYVFEQRITIINAKGSSSSPLSSIKILDQIPVSEDETIAVNLTQPPLLLPQQNKKGILQPAEIVNVKVAEKETGCRVKAFWDGMDDESEAADPALVGKDGKLSWVCEELAPQGKVVLALAWEVVCPYGTDIMGLDM